MNLAAVKLKIDAVVRLEFPKALRQAARLKRRWRSIASRTLFEHPVAGTLLAVTLCQHSSSVPVRGGPASSAIGRAVTLFQPTCRSADAWRRKGDISNLNKETRRNYLAIAESS